MSALAKLRTSLTGLSNDVAEVQKPVNRTYSAAKTAKATLAKPRQLSKAMQGLITKADTLSNSAVVLTPFPVIGTLAGRIGTIMRKVKSTAEKIKRTADRLDTRSKPAQKAVDTILPPLNKAKMSLDRAQALLQGWLAIVTELERRFGKTPPAEVESACAKMNASLAPDIKAITGAKPALRKNLDTVGGALEGIAVACKPVDPALSAAQDVARRLRPLEGPLNELRKALRPVRWALDAVSWVTRKVIDPIVNEILKAVGLKRLVDRLERTLNPFAAHLAPLQKAAAPLSEAVKAIGATARITAPLARIPELEKQVVAGMRLLKRLSSTAVASA
jgi:hypothetical protein